MGLGDRIRHYRKKVGWTLEKLSELSEVDVGTISALEKRGSKRSQYAVPIASAFGLTVNQLEDPDHDYEIAEKPKPKFPKRTNSDTASDAREPPPTSYASLTPDEQIVVHGFRQGNDGIKKGMLALARSALPEQESFTLRSGTN